MFQSRIFALAQMDHRTWSQVSSIAENIAASLRECIICRRRLHAGSLKAMRRMHWVCTIAHAGHSPDTQQRNGLAACLGDPTSSSSSVDDA